MLCYVTLRYIVLYYIILYCVMLYYIMLYYIILCYIIVPVVLYGCETWLLTLREERRLRVFENSVLSRVLYLYI